MTEILKVEDLQIRFIGGKKDFSVVNGISFALNRGETLGIIGESGSGKSISCMGILGLLARDKWRVYGDIRFGENPLPYNDNRAMRPYRGRHLALIIQNPLSAFNQMIPIAAHFYETLNVPNVPPQNMEQVRHQAREILARMRIRDPDAVLDSYAFQLSGGMLQRIMIALALVMKPDILIADEPTTALDLTVQHEIITILQEMQEKQGTAILLISHDLGVIAHLASTIAVIYAGEFVEKGKAEALLECPAHPYTQGLFASRPKFSKERLPIMEGQPPRLFSERRGCAFYPRCKSREDSCMTSRPSAVSAFSGGKEHETWCSRTAPSSVGHIGDGQ
ncbi:MAG: ABC transporter ATP-binding protein [Treponema sp.]|jgi:oligopeptide/dipeptide ABC transporter ATP-binding protein|nr:ABC transporter ATP-binding protein [Treponema sp.]